MTTITHLKLSYAHHNFHTSKVTTKRSHSLLIPFGTKLRNLKQTCDQDLDRKTTTVIFLLSRGLIFCILGIFLKSNLGKK
jgi:hypothetical protein